MTSRTSHIVISLCYAYVAGIVADMLFPAHATALRVLWVITACALLGFGAFTLLFALEIRKRDWWFLPAALCVLFLFGYTRHLAAVSIPEHRVAAITIDNAGHVEGARRLNLPDTSRLRLVKASATANDLVLRLAGELRARIPDYDENGLARLDERGRWLFHFKTMPIVSEPIHIKADDPIGTVYPIPQPFSAVTSVVCVSGTGPAEMSLYRVSNHASSFARAGRMRPAVTVLGRVTHDPFVYANKTLLSITPGFIQYEQGGPFYRAEGGDIRALLYPDAPDYNAIARTEAYGYHVQARGELRKPLGPANPGDFNQRQYMNNHNFFGTLFVDQGMIAIVNMPDGTFAKGNPLVEFSLNVRDRMLVTLKQTLPMPHSAFVGAITLGMRYGLAGRPGLFSDYYDKIGQGCTRQEYENMDEPHKGWEDTIEMQFKRAGVNHVLAVSGLHVTIITAMFVGIFTLLRIPKRMFVPITISALVVFAIITGARPSTLRAVIMNSLFLLTWAYMKQGLRSAALFGLAIAAFLILVHNPLMIVDPSFTLSFAAILSLVLLTGPAYQQLCRLRGNVFLVFLAFIGVSTVLAIQKFALFFTPSFLIVWAVLWVLIAFLAKRIERRFHPIDDIGFQDLPVGFSTFFSAQFAIQIGMMLPLSAIYFMRWPFGGMYANILAIPLAGVIIQLGMIAGLLGMIPGVGIYLALILNAANWIASTAFLFISHVVARGCPWPFVAKWHPWLVVVYYLYCLGFVYRKELVGVVKKALAFFQLTRAWHARTAVGMLAVLLAAPLVFSGDSDRDKLRISILSVRYGSAIFVQTPAGANFLFDGGSVTFGERGFNNTIRTVLPFLARKGILHLDAAILTSPNLQRAAGVADIITEYRVDRLYVPESISGISSTMSKEDLENHLLNGRAYDGADTLRFTELHRRLVSDSRWPKRLTLLKALRHRGESWLNRWADLDVEVLPLHAGRRIYEETGPDGEKLTIDVLHPDSREFAQRPVDNRSTVIRIQYGDFRMLLTGDLHYEGQKYLADTHASEELEADVCVIPGHGAHIPAGPFAGFDAAMKGCFHRGLAPFLAKVAPSVTIFEYGDPKPILIETFRDARGAYELTRRFVKENCPDTRVLSTDKDQAILITSNGRTYHVKTQAELEAGAGEAVGEGAADIGYAF